MLKKGNCTITVSHHRVHHSTPHIFFEAFFSAAKTKGMQEEIT
jgi:hypothetical protein